MTHPQYKWNKWGKYWVWEGDYLVVVGNSTTGYGVFEKGIVTIRRDRISSRHRGYYGTYKTRREALDCLKLVDKAMDKGEELVLRLSEGDPVEFEKGGAWSSYVPETGAFIIVYHEDFPTDLIHELTHKKLGHYRKRVTPEEEVAVVGATIKRMKKDGLYSPEERMRTIDLLAGYMKGSRAETRRQSGELVSALEAGKRPQLEGISWKTRRGGLG